MDYVAVFLAGVVAALFIVRTINRVLDDADPWL